MTPATGVVTMHVTTAATTHALACVLAVLHSRGAALRHLTWTCGESDDAFERAATAVITVTIEDRRQNHLRASLRRLIDVTAVDGG